MLENEDKWLTCECCPDDQKWKSCVGRDCRAAFKLHKEVECARIIALECTNEVERVNGLRPPQEPAKKRLRQEE